MEKADSEPIAWLATIAPEEGTEPVPVVFVERTEHEVLVRQADPDEPLPPRIPIYLGDKVVVMQAITHSGVHLSEEVGSAEFFLFGQRIVPVKEEPGKVFARTLRFGEKDTGRRVHVRPGDQVVLELTVDLRYIDSVGEASESGHTPLTPTLWTWFMVGPPHDEVKVRYLLAAARRLDTANRLFIEVDQKNQILQNEGMAGPEIRRHGFELLGAVEVAMVALWRAIVLVTDARQRIGTLETVPNLIEQSRPAVRAIRDAYEHIEDRALGNVWNKQDPTALTIFDQRRLMNEGILAYGEFEVDLSDMPELIRSIREYLFCVASKV